MGNDPELDAALDALLASIARGADDLDAPVAVRLLGPARVEPRMRSLANDPRWEARAAVAAVLRWLPGEDGAQPAQDAVRERALLVGAMAEREADARALAELVAAFVELKSAMSEPEVVALGTRYATHASADVRGAAIAVLSGSDHEEALATLVRATRDEHPRVRDTACFGLGHMLGSPSMPGGIVDTAEIREALAARLDDDDVETREEAATGLALRGDERGLAVVETLLARFDEEGVTQRVLMTASEAPHARYVAPLEQIVRESPDLEAAVWALEECRAAATRRVCRGPRLHAACDCFRGLPGLPRP